jgi:hypothetical protein
MWSVQKVSELFFYNFFRHACNWVSLIAFNVLPSCIDALLPTLLPLLESPSTPFSGSRVAPSANFL